MLCVALDVKEALKGKANLSFGKNSSNGFVWLGVEGLGSLWLGNENSNSYCTNLSHGFEGIQDTTLTGENTTHVQGPYHHYTRLFAIQLQ